MRKESGEVSDTLEQAVFCLDFLNSVTGRSSEADSIVDAKCGRASVRGTGVRTVCSQSIRRVSREHVAWRWNCRVIVCVP